MPPRIPLLSAIRRPAAFIKTPSTSLSTTSSTQGLRSNDSATSSILNLDSDDSSSPSSSSSSSSPNPAGGSTASVFGMYNRFRLPPSGERGTTASRDLIEQRMRTRSVNDDYARQMTRRWRIGDVYSPRDLGPGEMKKWRRFQPRKLDVVDILGLHPLDMYRNFSVISEFVTPFGRIQRSVNTGLRPPNQRKMAKAIRRAIGLGLHPSVHRHPELLMRQASRTYEQNQATMNKDLKWS
ncbi:ribosomal protein S18 [Biscogniauxia marginata]|nr:ribosomal protein S18 [Biscogniauxia marginata]